MSYQRDGKIAHRWSAWVHANRALIDRLNLPSDVFFSRDQFEYLLQHGYNQSGWWNEQPWFEVSDDDRWKSLFWQLLEPYVEEFFSLGERARQRELLAHFVPKPTD